MNESEYKQFYECSPPHLSKAEAVAMEYHRRTEAFDQSRCQCKRERSGIAIPMHGDELADCSNNARNVRRELANEFCIDADELRRAISRTAAQFELEFAHSHHPTAAAIKRGGVCGIVYP